MAEGLVDGAAYEDDLPALLGDGKGGDATTLSAHVYMGMGRATRIAPIGRPKVIGVIPVHGAIAMSGPIPFGGATSDKLIAAIRAARKNKRVRGVVLHVDSPGGSALASDLVHHELVQLAAEKPLVACFANVAASGGYYVAAAAHEIIAEPTTITGSIGVVATRFVVGPLLARLGVVTETVKRGARADMMDPSRALTPDERAALTSEIAGMYRAFVDKVAVGRKLSTDDVEKIAEGRVWTGVAALSHGLVDALGGFDLALTRVRARVGGEGAELLRPVIVRGPREPGVALPKPSDAAKEMLARALDLEAFGWVQGKERVLLYSHLARSVRS